MIFIKIGIFFASAITVLASPIFQSDERFIVVFKDTADISDFAFHEEFLERHFVNSENDVNWFSFEEKGNLIAGYVSNIPYSMLEVIITDPAIHYIEPDSPVEAFEITQKDAPWGLSRTSHHDKNDENEYYYDENDGENVDVYVIDTGIFLEHEDFENRAKWGTTINSRRPNNPVKTDDNGHGTHCSGIIAGKKYGMCKKCSLIAVKVLDNNGSGSMSDVLAGVEWTMNDHKKKEKNNNKRKSVVNMSLGGGTSKTLNRMVDAAVDSGIYFVVAAGNSYDNSCDYSPASSEKAITVGSSNIHDFMSSFSNFGECNDIFAPGENIKSTYPGSSDSTAVLSGTSMASPHVAGAVGALLSRKEYSEMTPKQMKKALKKLSTKDVLNNVPEDTENHLLYTRPEKNKMYQKFYYETFNSFDII